MFGPDRHVAKCSLRTGSLRVSQHPFCIHDTGKSRLRHPTIPSIHRPLFQLRHRHRHHHSYTIYLCTVTLLVRTSAIAKVHSTPAYETHRGGIPRQGRKRKMQQEPAVTLTASSAVVLACIQEKEHWP